MLGLLAYSSASDMAISLSPVSTAAVRATALLSQPVFGLSPPCMPHIVAHTMQVCLSCGLGLARRLDPYTNPTLWMSVQPRGSIRIPTGSCGNLAFCEQQCWHAVSFSSLPLPLPLFLPPDDVAPSAVPCCLYNMPRTASSFHKWYAFATNMVPTPRGDHEGYLGDWGLRCTVPKRLRM